MRQASQNQNKRMRGRGRKGPNVLSRSFESNGPDVKVRGTAMHIAEKYQQLARDAHASGDRIMAENYYQHAEHYSRMVAAAQPQSEASSQGSRGSDDERVSGGDERNGGATERSSAVEVADVSEEGPSRSAESRARVMPEDAPQPFIDGMPNTNTKRAGANGSGEGNGAADEAPVEASSQDGEEDSAKPRRRTRGTRGRGTRRVAPVAAAAEDGDGASEPVADTAPVADAAPVEASEA